VSEETKGPPASAPNPGIVTALLSMFLPLIAVPIVVTIAIVAAVLVSPSAGAESFGERCKDWIPAHSGSLTGLLVLLVPAQATILGIACAGSRGRGLGFTAWTQPARTIALAVLGTLGIQWASASAFDLLRIEPSEHLKELWRMLAVPGLVPTVVVGLFVSVVPAICEEALFRGVGQRRLLERWPPAAAIGVAGLFFALGHGDVQHALMVLPLGLWFGFVAWKTGSTRASALCHGANNAFGILVGRALGDPDTGNLPSTWPFVAAGLLLCACTVMAARALARAGSRS
jgi:membrane protease YdiL (CAAX protease family)